MADKVEQCDVHVTHGSGGNVSGYLVSDSSSNRPKEESALSKLTHGRSETFTVFFRVLVRWLGVISNMCYVLIIFVESPFP